MNTLSLAWRNLLRNRRRSLMTLIAMILGLTAVLLFGGYIRDINYSLQTNFVTSTGHLQIQHKDYFRFGSGNPSAYGIQNYERVIAAVRKDPVIAPMLAVITPTLQFGAIAGNFAAGVSRTVFINGTVVEDQNQMREWNDYGQRDLSSRHLSLSGTPPDTAVIGTGVARVLHLCAPLKVEDCAPEDSKKAVDGAALPDDISDLAMLGTTKNAVTKPDAGPRIEILAANARGAPNVAGVNVLAAEFQGVKEVDDIYIALHLSQAQKLVFGAAPPQATAIAIQLKHTAQIPEVRARLETLLTTELRGEPLAVLDYETLNPFYGQTLAMFAAIFGFISMLMGFDRPVYRQQHNEHGRGRTHLGDRHAARHGSEAERHPGDVRQRGDRSGLLWRSAGNRHRRSPGMGHQQPGPDLGSTWPQRTRAAGRQPGGSTLDDHCQCRRTRRRCSAFCNPARSPCSAYDDRRCLAPCLVRVQGRET
jgi:putative ABC transport system permease protein